MARLKKVGVDQVVVEESRGSLINGAEVIFSLIPRKVITAELDNIPTKIQWKWLTRIQRIKLNTGLAFKYKFSYYSLDFKEN